MKVDTKKLIAKLTTVIKKPLIIREATISGTVNVGGAYSITAPAVTGYTFLCWLDPSYDGYAGVGMLASHTTNPTYLWHIRYAGTDNSQTVTVRIPALYIRSDLA